VLLTPFKAWIYCWVLRMFYNSQAHEWACLRCEPIDV
jgi:hypothetical protein